MAMPHAADHPDVSEPQIDRVPPPVARHKISDPPPKNTSLNPVQRPYNHTTHHNPHIGHSLAVTVAKHTPNNPVTQGDCACCPGDGFSSVLGSDAAVVC